MNRLTLHTISLVFTDGSDTSHQVLSLDMGPVFDEAERYFMDVHTHPHARLSHLIITNPDGLEIARWAGVNTSS
jgi:hypothetical protein